MIRARFMPIYLGGIAGIQPPVPFLQGTGGFLLIKEEGMRHYKIIVNVYLL
jgi:hypothetical protein